MRGQGKSGETRGEAGTLIQWDGVQVAKEDMRGIPIVDINQRGELKVVCGMQDRERNRGPISFLGLP